MLVKRSNGLGNIANYLLEKVPIIQGLVLTGRDTLKAVCRALGVTEIELYLEIERGLSFGKIRTKNNSYWAVTKAGNDTHSKKQEFS
jgi:D-threonate/D-erythronate kinase